VADVLVGCDGHNALHVVAAFPHGQVIDGVASLYDDIASALAKHGIPSSFSEAWTAPFDSAGLPDYSKPPWRSMLWIHSEYDSDWRQRYEQVRVGRGSRRVA
jgi:hypothetical protein